MVFKNIPIIQEFISSDEEILNESVSSNEYQTDVVGSNNSTNDELNDFSPLCSFCKLKCNQTDRLERYLPCLRVICEVI